MCTNSANKLRNDIIDSVLRLLDAHSVPWIWLVFLAGGDANVHTSVDIDHRQMACKTICFCTMCKGDILEINFKSQHYNYVIINVYISY